MPARKVDLSENIKVVTKNDFIQGRGMDNASIKAFKLMYIAIAQCKVNDQEFYEYSMTIPEFALAMGVAPTNIYQEAEAITDELMKAFIRFGEENSRKFRKRHVFARCDYDDQHGLTFRIDKEMTDLLLGITSDFSQPLLNEFLKMKSVYSIKVWHLLQREMKSQKYAFAIEGREPEFYITLEELRRVTGTENKLKKLSQFKERVLEIAVRDIEECAGVRITYRDHKSGRTVVGFYFKQVPIMTILEDKAKEIDEKLQEYRNSEEIQGQMTFMEYLNLQTGKE